MKKISFIILVITLFLKDFYLLSCFLFLELILFYISKNSLKEFAKKLYFLLIPLSAILIFNYQIFHIIFFKSFISLLSISHITSNFDIKTIVSALKKCHFPQYIIEIFLLSLRYSHSFLEDVTLIKKNLWLKGNYKKKTFLQSSFLGPIIGNLFLRGIKKAEKVYQAMKLRGY